MTSRTFGMADQRAFAEFSGDVNPVHVDPVQARRTLFGRPIVHGIHAVAWALDDLLHGPARGRVPGRVRVVFKKAIGVDEPVAMRLTRDSSEQTRLVLENGHSPAMSIRVEWATAAPMGTRAIPDRRPPTGTCRALELEDIDGLAGALPLVLPTEARTQFEALCDAVKPARLASLLATSHVVGMECPGLHSIYSELEVTFGDDAGGAPELDWHVERADERFKLISIAASGPGFEARIKAFLRPPPAVQKSFSTLKSAVERVEFEDQRALVVGGSRGLGEVTAKLLAAGGAQVLITYHHGLEDAERVSREILAGGGSASAHRLDIRDLAASPDLASWKPTHLYYFATPPIFTANADVFQDRIFEVFLEFYVTAFVRLVSALRAHSADLEAILYPSSVAVDELPPAMVEYAAAKAAGEKICEALAQRGLRVARPRLPRLATDQTMSVARVENQDPVPVLLDALRALQREAPAP